MSSTANLARAAAPRRRIALKRQLLATLAVLTLPGSAFALSDAAPEGRLPDDAVPQAYRIDLTIDPDKARFSGHVEIDVAIKAASRSLWINGRDLHVASVEARIDGKMIPARYVQVDPLGVARLDFAAPLPTGRATLVIDYDAPFRDGASGLYRVQADGKWYVWSQFESVEARSAYPGFDQPGYKTPFAITLTTRPGLVTVSNAPEIRTVDAAGGMVRHVFAPTKPLPTYLTAIVVGPFAVATGQIASTPERTTPLPIRIIATQQNRERLRFALTNTAPIIAHLEEYFGKAFPFPKLDQIASPAMPGAMENAGADIYPEGVLLVDESAPTEQLQEFGSTVSHELSHQWFGDLVTPAWWSDIWLNESFANWMGYRIGNEWRPDLKLGTAAIGQAFEAMNIDALTAGRPIHQPIATTGEIDTAFDAVTYGKGGQVVAMIASYMGDTGFQKGVRLHLSRYAYGTATTDQFFRSLSDAAHDPRIDASLRSFVDQQGVPVVTVRRNGGTVTLTQAPYALLGTTPAPRSWIIPFCYAVDGKRDCVLMDKSTMTVPAKAGGTFMPNAGGTGYYRFSLNEADWRSLIATAGALPPGEALATTDSLWADFKAGHASAASLLAEARTIVANPYSTAAIDPGIRLRALRKLGLINEPTMPAYRRTIRELYAPRLAAMGFDPKAGTYAAEPADRRKLRTSLVSLVGLDASDPAVRSRLVDAALAWLGGDTRALDQSFYPAALSAYVAANGLPAAQVLLERALISDDAFSRAVALDVIGRSGNAGIADWLVGRLDDTRLHMSDRMRLVRLLMGDAATRDIGYQAALRRFDQFAKGGFNAVSGLMAAPSGFCSTQAATMIDRDLRPKVAQYRVSAIDLDRTLEQIRDCEALKEAAGHELTDALTRE